MENTDGTSITSLTAVEQDVLSLDNVASYNFYQLVELINNIKKSHYAADQELKGIQSVAEMVLMFSSSPSLGFAASDVTKLEALVSGVLNLETTFLGLNGAHSPLPGYILEQIVTEDETGLRRSFLDFFNHHLISLIHQIWRKYRYYIRYENGASDDFSALMFALVGLADDRLRVETCLNWCKTLSYSGLLAGRSRSPQVVAGIISHYFDIEKVAIKQWVKRKVAIAKEQQFCLGKHNAVLGHDTLIGDYIVDQMSKFVVCLDDLTLARFIDFLPSGKEYPVFITLVEFILREQLAFDLALEIKEEETPSMHLVKQSPPLLGWTSFMGQQSSIHNRQVLIQIRK